MKAVRLILKSWCKHIDLHLPTHLLNMCSIAKDYGKYMQIRLNCKRKCALFHFFYEQPISSYSYRQRI